ncbi:MAG: hemerythrin domain-containing protein [Melioribacteraceae bacterium]|nr:hemerythrin domain-containing protein [Melioribacteraceae bacterium]
MKRHSAIVSLSHDHHHALILAQAIKKNAAKSGLGAKSIWEKVKATINAYNTELIPHFSHEEVLLFPIALGKDEELDKMIEDIMEEHDKIRIAVEFLNTGNIEENLDAFGRSLEQHVRTEERILFPKIEEVVGDEELNILNGQIIAVKDSCAI